MQGQAPQRSGRSVKRHMTLVSVGTVAAAGAATAGVLVVDDAEAGTLNKLPAATAEITRTNRTLSKTVEGRLGFSQRRPVKSAVEGTVTVASEEGATLRRGETLYALNDTPVTLLYGPVPMFREMKTGDRGSEVLQLERESVCPGTRIPPDSGSVLRRSHLGRGQAVAEGPQPRDHRQGRRGLPAGRGQGGGGRHGPRRSDRPGQDGPHRRLRPAGDPRPAGRGRRVAGRLHLLPDAGLDHGGPA